MQLLRSLAELLRDEFLCAFLQPRVPLDVVVVVRQRIDERGGLVGGHGVQVGLVVVVVGVLGAHVDFAARAALVREASECELVSATVPGLLLAFHLHTKCPSDWLSELAGSLDRPPSAAPPLPSSMRAALSTRRAPPKVSTTLPLPSLSSLSTHP